MLKVLFFANTDWYLYNFRLPWAKYLRSKNLDVVMLSPTGPYGPLLQAEGFRWIALDMDRRSLNPAGEVALIRRIASVYAAEKPDIVHHFTIKCVVYGSLIARWNGIRNRVNAVTGMGYVFSDTGLRARLLQPIVRSLIKAALSGEGSRLILQNKDDVAAFVAADLASQEHIHLIMGSGIDTSRFQPSTPTRERKVMRVLLASRLIWEKGIGDYVKAARLLKAENAPVEFLLAGSPDPGNPRSVPWSQVAEWQQDGAITYLGHVTDMPRLLADVDVVVLPTSYREGVPRCLLEAAACAIPIVTTDVAGCRELVTHGVNGLLVPARDAPALADAIRFMQRSPEDRRRMGLAGREAAINAFDERIVFERTFAVYQDLLAAA